VQKIFLLAGLCLSCCASAQQIDLPSNFGRRSIQVKDGKVIDFSNQFNYNLGFGEYSVNYTNKTTSHNFTWNKFNTIANIQYVNRTPSFSLNTNQFLFGSRVRVDAYKQNNLFISNYEITKGKNTIVWHNNQCNTQSNSFDLFVPKFHASYDLNSHNFRSTYKQFGYTNINNKSTYYFEEKWINIKLNDEELCLGLKEKEIGIQYNQSQVSKIIILSTSKNNFSTLVNLDLEKNKFSGFSLNYSKKF
jgi:hypothetical protein